MSVRFFRMGEFQSQHDQIHFQNLGFGRSIIVEGSTTNQEQSTFPVDAASGHGWKVNVSTDTDFTYGAINCGLDLLKAKLGQIPILIKVDFQIYSRNDRSYTVQIYRFIRKPVQGDASNRYLDRTNLIPWYEDVYAPFKGQDIEKDPLYFATGQSILQGERTHWNVTSVFARSLRDNVDIDFMARLSNTGTSSFEAGFAAPGQWPYFDIFYYLPVEFYQAFADGSIDVLSPVDDQPGNEYYLGAVERGQTGTPIKGFIRNMTAETQQIEIFDDHPESEVPVQRAGSGTGQLDYVVLDTTAVSQLYTVVFYSSIGYEVIAESYRDNPVSLHPQIDTNPLWRDNTLTDFVTPDGGLRIPAAAWQALGIKTGDQFEVGVRGNTSNETWPADSASQVEVTFDESNAPDQTNWRKVNGRRISVASATVIDAATKLIPTQYVDPSQWPIGTRGFIQDPANINHGTVKSVQEAEIGTPVHTGTGTDDVTVSGNYNGYTTGNYRLEIDAAGTPGTFKWSPDGGSSWSETGVVPTGSLQLLEHGIYVTVPAATARVLGDYWDIPVSAFAVELEGLTPNSNAYGAGAIVGTTLPFRDVAPAVFGQVTQQSGAAQSFPNRIWLEPTDGFAIGDQILCQQIEDEGLSELAIVDSVGTGYLDMTADLELTYNVGDVVTKTDSGERGFWYRPVANETTVEQAKELRVNARML